MGVDHRLPPVELLPDRREGCISQVFVQVARHQADALRLERIQGVTDFLERSLGIEKGRSEEHTSELQSHLNLVCRLLLEKKKKIHYAPYWQAIDLTYAPTHPGTHTELGTRPSP